MLQPDNTTDQSNESSSLKYFIVMLCINSVGGFIQEMLSVILRKILLMVN